MGKYTLPPEHQHYLGRTCKKCNEFKHQDAFQIEANKKALFGLTISASCKECIKKDSWKDEIRYRYGLSVDEYNAILERQNGVCAICRSNTANNKRTHPRLFVDHCHTTGKVRGLLCSKCNHALGQFNDDIELLDRAKSYLISHQAA